MSSDLVVAMPPELDVVNIDQTRQGLQEAIRSGAAVVIVDLTETTYCDSSAISGLLRTIRDAGTARVQVRFAIPPGGGVMRIIQLTGMDKLMTVYPTVALAREAHSGADS